MRPQHHEAVAVAQVQTASHQLNCLQEPGQQESQTRLKQDAHLSFELLGAIATQNQEQTTDINRGRFREASSARP